MYPTPSTPKPKSRRLLAAAASAALALGGLSLVAAPAAHASTTQVARPASYAPVANGSCMDAEIDGQTRAAYPISCSPPSFPALWDASAKKQIQTTAITLYNTSNSTLHLVPAPALAPNGVGPGGGGYSESIPEPYLPAKRPETITWKVTLLGPWSPSEVNGAPVAILGESFHITNFGTDPNAGVSWKGDYPTTSGAPSYSVALTASSTSPTTGSSTTITAKNTGSTTEDITLCASGRPIAAGRHTPGSSLEHAVTSGSAGSRTFTAYAGASYGCSGASESLVVDWTGSAPSPPTHTGVLSPLAIGGSVGEPAGQPDPLYVADTQAPGAAPEWLTMCVNGRAVASGRHNPGTVLTHDVSVSSPGATVTVDAYSGASPKVCAGPEKTFTVTGAAAGPANRVPNLHVFAGATSAPVGTQVPIWVTDTASGPTWISLCVDGRAVASAWKHPGQGMPHVVSSAKTGTVTYDIMQGRDSCSGGLEGQTSIDWTAAS